MVEAHYAKAGPLRYLDVGPGHQRRPRGPTRSIYSCRRGSAIPGHGTSTPPSRSSPRPPSCSRHPPSFPGGAGALGRARAGWGGGDPAFLRERHQRPSALRRVRRARLLPKDGINDRVVAGGATVNPGLSGTKCAFWYQVTVATGAHRRAAHPAAPPRRQTRGVSALGKAFDEVMAARRAEADEFYAELTPAGASADEALVMRQAFAGMLWSKQLYYYDVSRWLDGDPTQPTPPPSRRHGRNSHWRTFDAFDIMSMPDKWEYPWFAAWDFAFHCIALAHVDPAFAKYQLVLLCREWFQHPNGALPAYEWDFGDINPPVQAVSALEVFTIDGGRDFDFLSRIFDKLLVNFTWWVNQEDKTGSNLFEGGFLGLDNIGPIDRSHLPVGGTLEQSDATGWMASYALSMAAIVAVLYRSGHRPANDLVIKFIEHFAAIRDAMDSQGMWDDFDGLFYDRLVTPDGNVVPVKVRSMVGIIPMLAAAVVDEGMAQQSMVVAKQFPRLLRDQGLDDLDKMSGTGLLQGEPGSRRLLLGVVNVERSKGL